MTIAPVTKGNAAQPLRTSPPPPGPTTPPAARDAYRPEREQVRVITYNTAVGNARIKTPQADFLKLPFYQDVIQGKPDAPILALQEVGNRQRFALARAAAETGNFQVVAVRTNVNQNNVLVLPKRYEVLEKDSSHFFGPQVRGWVTSLRNFVTSGFRKLPRSSGDLIEARGFAEAKLKDTVTGKTFTVFDTHLALDDSVRNDQTRQLMGRAQEAAETGGVIVAGDLNTRTPGSDPAGKDAATRALFGDFEDMGAEAVTHPRLRRNIDWVLGKGVTPVSGKVYSGDALGPGFPRAAQVSDHFAEEAVLTLD